MQPQLRGALAEVIVATRDDPAYGLHLMVGGGGGTVETDADVAWTRMPVSPSNAEQLLLRTKVGRRLAAKAPAKLEAGALPAIVAAIAALAEESRDSVTEIEVNPLIVTAKGAVAVDAVVTLR